MWLLLFILICFGATNAIINNSYFNFLRNTNSKFINKMFSCSLCLGFWVGAIVFIIMKRFCNVEFNFIPNNIISCVTMSFVSSGICYILCGIGNVLENNDK